ncbi:hypothetical protein [Aquisphaera insulae]|uniref:hypothetical protein n=1 Tax=Aquisphaera insulae TaxID=2712864 RepID=UPI0013EB672C|nr:hypothetical protein [Aquisphaera insulae]
MHHPINLILHPGHSKCGSTAIQSSLYHDLEVLERKSVFIPDSRLRFRFEPILGPAHSIPPVSYFQDLMTGMLDLSHLERRIDEALAHAADAGCRTILISSENLCNLHLTHAQAMHRLLASLFSRVKVIYYIRQPDDWIFSAWQQWGHKLGQSLGEWTDYCLLTGLPAFLSNATRFQEIYGEGSVSVIPVHRSAFPAGGLLADFYERLGVEPPDPRTSAGHQNLSLNPYLCEVLGSIDGIYSSIDDNSVRGLFETLCPPELLFGRDRNYMGKGLRDRILDFYEADDRELHRRFFGSLEFDEIFARPVEAGGEPPHARMEGLKNVLAINTRLLLHLIRTVEEGSPPAVKRGPLDVSAWPAVPRAEVHRMQAGAEVRRMQAG